MSFPRPDLGEWEPVIPSDLGNWEPVIPSLFREPVREVLVIVVRRGWYVSPIEAAIDDMGLWDIYEDERLEEERLWRFGYIQDHDERDELSDT